MPRQGTNLCPRRQRSRAAVRIPFGATSRSAGTWSLGAFGRSVGGRCLAGRCSFDVVGKAAGSGSWLACLPSSSRSVFTSSRARQAVSLRAVALGQCRGLRVLVAIVGLEIGM